MNAVNMTSGSAGAMDKQSAILYPLMLIAAIAVIVFSISGIAAMMGWMPGALSRGACQNCGVVESVRAVEKTRRYEIRLRMDDGTPRMLYEATRPTLTIGQKVRVTERGIAAAR